MESKSFPSIKKYEHFGSSKKFAWQDSLASFVLEPTSLISLQRPERDLIKSCGKLSNRIRKRKNKTWLATNQIIILRLPAGNKIRNIKFTHETAQRYFLLCLDSQLAVSHILNQSIFWLLPFGNVANHTNCCLHHETKY